MKNSYWAVERVRESYLKSPNNEKPIPLYVLKESFGFFPSNRGDVSIFICPFYHQENAKTAKEILSEIQAINKSLSINP